ncbi:preprotein translocase subunit SecA [Hugenholtzia roseola]|uniref:preprotein translocase subunit SecA n=1 Tax=Hugenholtzia roseola TaxID=1002 RepID=UPI00041F3D73|nr:preprotein translocase subunit SecA [Hugenholtzia roseola]
MDFLTKAIVSVFGTKSDRDRKKLLPYVEKVNAEFNRLASLSDDQLRERTQDVKALINAHLKDTDDKIADLRRQIAENPEMEIQQKETIFTQIDELEKQRNKELEVVLEQVLPQGFAIVKETARRFKENKKIVVTANDNDRKHGNRYAKLRAEGKATADSGVELTADGKAIWYNKWLVAGQELAWDMVHYDVQIIGGVVLHQGKIAEMATGEGKTLVSTFPSFLNALADRGVHLVTVNDYLAKRDSEWMAPLFEFHGMSVDCIDKHQPNTEARRNAYRASITYGTNNEFGFDYLRDNMAREVDELVQRQHHFAMVDEVDSVLIDDARTPLIISGPVSNSDDKEDFNRFKPRVADLVKAQEKLILEFLNEAKRLLKEGKDKEAALPILRAYRGLPEYKPLIKFLSEQGVKAILQRVENEYLSENARRMPEADEPLFFTIEKKNNQVQLTQKGIQTLTKQNEEAGFFVLPVIGVEIAKIEKRQDLDEPQKAALKDKLMLEYNAKASRIHTVSQLLKAYTLFEKDVDYIVSEDGKVKIVDEQTGRIMEGRRYSEGLHQALEAKENVEVEDATQTYATVTLQNYFRMYHKLAGMTGTAETEAAEFGEIYKLDVVSIPTNRKISRFDLEDKVFKTEREKLRAIVAEIKDCVEKKRPVLVGTTSVEKSEILSKALSMLKIPHQVLNAKQHAKEAEIVALAGIPGTVTIATNMAGRGTDIKLTPEAKAAGGLAIIGTERHESRRVDRQLRGRAGRQGDPGSSQFFVSLEDPLMRMFGSDKIASIMDRLGLQEGEVIQHSMITKSIERAQRKVEENNFGARKHLLEYDDVMNKQRNVIYKRRRNALFGERLDLDLMEIFYQMARTAITTYKGDYAAFQHACYDFFGLLEIGIDENQFRTEEESRLVQLLYRKVYQDYKAKKQAIAQKLLPVLESVYQERGKIMQQVTLLFNEYNYIIALPSYPNANGEPNSYAAIPFSDGKRYMNPVIDVKRAIESKGTSLMKEMEQNIVLSIIDNLWKEHLREMDELRKQVQMVRFEQKDPLVVYKFEAFNLFKQLIADLNEEVVQFLSKVQLHQQDPADVERARAAFLKQEKERAEREKQMQTNQAERSGEIDLQSDNQKVGNTQPQEEKITPRTVTKEPDRNQTIKVRYHNGEIVEGKYKKLKADLDDNKCVLI